jgi:hypothetical protein
MGGADQKGTSSDGTTGCPLFGAKIGRVDFRGRLFLPLGALKSQDGLERDLAHALPDGELVAGAVFFLVHPRAQLAHQLNVHPFFQRRRELRQPVPRPPLCGIKIVCNSFVYPFRSHLRL